MEIVPEPKQINQFIYLTHLSVLKTDRITTKLRVVFNASIHTNNGTSINDHLLSGAKIQNDLVSIILRWRNLRFVNLFSRQILL